MVIFFADLHDGFEAHEHAGDMKIACGADCALGEGDEELRAVACQYHCYLIFIAVILFSMISASEFNHFASFAVWAMQEHRR